MNIASLPGIGITSKICLLTATLTDKDNPSSDTLLSHNSSNSQETFVEGRQVRSQMARRGIYSAHECSVSKSHNENTNISGLYVNTLEYTELLNGLIFDRVYGS